MDVQLQHTLSKPYSGRQSCSHRALGRTAATARSLLVANAAKPKQPVYIEDAATQSFLDWARSAAGIQFAKLRPATFDGVRGLAASSQIAVDDLIVSVPRQKALTLPPKQRCPCQDFVSPTYWDASPWFVKLAVRLMAEQRKGPTSTLAQWIQTLPSHVDSPVAWSAEMVQQLQYGHLIHKVTEQQQEWAGLYDKFRDEGVVDKAAPPSKQEFFRALSLVRSRTFSGPYVASTLSDRVRLSGLVGGLVVANTLLGGDLSKGLGAAAAVFLFNVIYELVLSSKLRQYAMCPVIDLLNHSSTNTTEVSYDYPRDAFLVSAGAAYSPGDQVFISYGAQTNDSLMQMYGFAEPDNPYDVYVMTSLLKWLEQLQPASQARLDRLNKEGLLHALQEVVITRQGFGAQTLQALRYLLVPAAGSAGSSDGAAGAAAEGDTAATADGSSSNGAAAAAAAAAQQGLPAVPPSSCELPADEDTEKKIALVLVHACQQELAVLGTTLQEDRQLLRHSNGSSSKGASRRKGGSETNSSGSSSGSDMAAAHAAAATFRMEKKKVLLACLDQLTGGTAAAAAAPVAPASRSSSSSSMGGADVTLNQAAAAAAKS